MGYPVYSDRFNNNNNNKPDILKAILVHINISKNANPYEI